MVLSINSIHLFQLLKTNPALIRHAPARPPGQRGLNRSVVLAEGAEAAIELVQAAVFQTAGKVEGLLALLAHAAHRGVVALAVDAL